MIQKYKKKVSLQQEDILRIKLDLKDLLNSLTILVISNFDRIFNNNMFKLISDFCFLFNIEFFKLINNTVIE